MKSKARHLIDSFNNFCFVKTLFFYQCTLIIIIALRLVANPRNPRFPEKHFQPSRVRVRTAVWRDDIYNIVYALN